MRKILIVIIIASCSYLSVFSRNNQNNNGPSTITQLAGCNPSTSSSDLDIGNVRTRVWINGDMWWDLAGTSLYEVPKGSGKNSLHAGAIWIGGKDGGGNLKIAAQTYRQSGSDFWPGPVDTSLVSIDSARCAFYDQHWKITRQEVADFINGGTPSPAIINWPGNGNATFSETHMLAPFYDVNGDGMYDYTTGDYPKYEFGTQSSNMNTRLNGDQTIWWVFNDVGNIHGETGSQAPIGIEIQAQAFAFCTNDTDLANTTFYSYKIINRNPNPLYETYFGTWTDVDLGNYLDDFMGCDVGRNMGYGYNADNFDDGVNGYGSQLPAIGIDILSGPLSDSNDGHDNNHNGIVDEPGETSDLNFFLCYNNDFTVTGNPSVATDYYNYLDGRWKNGVRMTYGGAGYDLASQDTSAYMFPDDSDPLHYGTYGYDYGFNWSEREPTMGGSPNNPGDRRFLMSSGKFTLVGGAVNYYTTAAVWAQADSSIDSSIAKLKRADDRIQSFFNSYFNNIPTCPLNIGIEEISKDEFSIYPNPAIGIIRFTTKENLGLKISIFGSDGKLIVKDIDVEKTFDVSTWSNGLYYFTVKDKKGRHASGKISVINQ